MYLVNLNRSLVRMVKCVNISAGIFLELVVTTRSYLITVVRQKLLEFMVK